MSSMQRSNSDNVLDLRGLKKPTTANHTATQKKYDRFNTPKLDFSRFVDAGFISGYNNHLRINSPFAPGEFAANFSVTDPRKAKGHDHIVYLVVGFD